MTKTNIDKRLEELESTSNITKKQPTQSQQAQIVIGDMMLNYCEFYKESEGIGDSITTTLIEYAQGWHRKLKEPIPKPRVSKKLYKKEQEPTEAPMDASIAIQIEKRKRIDHERNLERQAHDQWSSPKTYLGPEPKKIELSE